jgi:hypothetical protein
VFNKKFILDASERARPDLRAVALREWSRMSVLASCQWKPIGPSGVTHPSGPSRVTHPSGPQPTRKDSGLVCSIAVGANPANVVIATRGGGV